MPRILLVEDSPTQAREISLVLEEAGFEMETALTAREGWSRLAQRPFDLVLTDLLLPGESGFELCGWIKADPERRKIPVLVMSRWADPANVLRGLAAGADGFMAKDREPAEIVSRIRRALARVGQHAGHDEPVSTQVVFVGQRFNLSLTRDQLVEALCTALEDVLLLNRRHQEAMGGLIKSAEALRKSEALHQALQQTGAEPGSARQDNEA